MSGGSTQQYDPWNTDDDFRSGLMLAVALHVLFLLVAFVVGRVLTAGSRDDGAIEIIRASVRVDVVGMPKHTLQELKQLQSEMKPTPVENTPPAQEVKTLEAEPEIKPGDAVIQEQGAPRKALSSLLSDLSKKEIKLKVDPKKGQKQGSTQGLDQLILEGNRVSKGSALVGDYSDQEASALALYVQVIPELVRAQWKLPTFLKDQNLKCRVRLWVGPQGEVLKTELYESSGNGEYDARAEQAIRSASPFPIPDAQVASTLSSKGVILGFPL